MPSSLTPRIIRLRTMPFATFESQLASNIFATKLHRQSLLVAYIPVSYSFNKAPWRVVLTLQQLLQCQQRYLDQFARSRNNHGKRLQKKILLCKKPRVFYQRTTILKLPKQFTKSSHPKQRWSLYSFLKD